MFLIGSVGEFVARKFKAVAASVHRFKCSFPSLAILLILSALSAISNTVVAAPSCVIIWDPATKAKAKCTGGVKLIHILHLPKPGKNHTPCLVPGFVWLRENQIAAADQSGIIKWTFSKKAVERTIIKVKRTPGEYLSGLFGSQHRLLLAMGTISKSPRLSVRGFSLPAFSPLAGICNPPFRETGAGRSGHRWLSFVIPPTLKWMAFFPKLIKDREAFHLWRFSDCKYLAIPAMVSEPDARMFTSGDGAYLGWVNGGHWMSLMKVGKSPKNIQRIHLFTQTGLRYGTLSPHDHRAVLVASHLNSGGSVKLIMVKTFHPSAERVLTLWPANYSAICACRPSFSVSGNNLAAAAYHLKARWKHGVWVKHSDIWVISRKQFKTFGYITILNDLPRAMSFSPDGSYLAVECWYRVFIFSVAKKKSFLPSPTWYEFWTAPKTHRLAGTHAMR